MARRRYLKRGTLNIEKWVWWAITITTISTTTNPSSSGVITIIQSRSTENRNDPLKDHKRVWMNKAMQAIMITSMHKGMMTQVNRSVLSRVVGREITAMHMPAIHRCQIFSQDRNLTEWAMTARTNYQQYMTRTAIDNMPLWSRATMQARIIWTRLSSCTMLQVMLRYTLINETEGIMMHYRTTMPLWACFPEQSQRIICIRITLETGICSLRVHSKFYKEADKTKTDYWWTDIGEMAKLKFTMEHHTGAIMLVARSQASELRLETRTTIELFDYSMTTTSKCNVTFFRSTCHHRVRETLTNNSFRWVNMAREESTDTSIRTAIHVSKQIMVLLRSTALLHPIRTGIRGL